MNAWQVARQIQYRIRALDWPGSTNPVFHTDAVIITQAIKEAAAERLILPACFIGIGSDTADAESPDKIEQMFSISLVVGHAGDAFGEMAVVGGMRTGQTSSQGRGLLEIQEPMKDALSLVNTDDGIVIQLRRSSAITPQQVAGQFLLIREYQYEVQTTEDRYYHPCRKFAGEVTGAAVDLTWGLPPDRYDRDSVILRRAAGTTPPPSVTDETGVTLAGDLSTSVSDAPGDGTWSYALFAAYDEWGTGSPTRYSSSVTLTVTGVVDPTPTPTPTPT